MEGRFLRKVKLESMRQESTTAHIALCLVIFRSCDV